MTNAKKAQTLADGCAPELQSTGASDQRHSAGKERSFVGHLRCPHCEPGA